MLDCYCSLQNLACNSQMKHSDQMFRMKFNMKRQRKPRNAVIWIHIYMIWSSAPYSNIDSHFYDFYFRVTILFMPLNFLHLGWLNMWYFNFVHFIFHLCYLKPCFSGCFSILIDSFQYWSAILAWLSEKVKINTYIENMQEVIYNYFKSCFSCVWTNKINYQGNTEIY